MSLRENEVKGRDGMILTHGYQPAPELLKRVRRHAGLTQERAALIVYVAVDTWRRWEAAETTANARRMPAALWELFLNKI